MPIVLGIIVSAAVIFAVFAVTLGHGGSMTNFSPDWPGRPLPPDRPVRPADVDAARFSLAFRGYRMAEVDQALARLAAEIGQRDEVIERLGGRFEFQPPPDDDRPTDASVEAAGTDTAGTHGADTHSVGNHSADTQPIPAVASDSPPLAADGHDGPDASDAGDDLDARDS